MRQPPRFWVTFSFVLVFRSFSLSLSFPLLFFFLPIFLLPHPLSLSSSFTRISLSVLLPFGKRTFFLDKKRREKKRFFLSLLLSLPHSPSLFFVYVSPSLLFFFPFSPSPHHNPLCVPCGSLRDTRWGNFQNKIFPIKILKTLYIIYDILPFFITPKRKLLSTKLQKKNPSNKKKREEKFSPLFFPLPTNP